MSKTAMLTARMEPGLKADAEGILANLGIPAGSAITLFYRQIVLHRGLPFAVTLNRNPLPDPAGMSQEEFDRELEIGDRAIREGRYSPADEVLSHLESRMAR